MPGPRIKQAAAAGTESKVIKKVLEESGNRCRKKGSQRPAAALAKKRASSTVFDFDDVAPCPRKRRGTRTKETKGLSRNACVDNRKKGPLSSHLKKSSGLDRLAYGLDSSDGSLSSSLPPSGSKQRRTIVVEFSTAEKTLEVEISATEQTRIEHQRRRSMRSINSTGPMHLSYRTSYRISISSASPTCSPILSTKLRFTPFAHLPTTPNASYGDK